MFPCPTGCLRQKEDLGMLTTPPGPHPERVCSIDKALFVSLLIPVMFHFTDGKTEAQRVWQLAQGWVANHWAEPGSKQVWLLGSFRFPWHLSSWEGHSTTLLCPKYRRTPAPPCGLEPRYLVSCPPAPPAWVLGEQMRRQCQCVLGIDIYKRKGEKLGRGRSQTAMRTPQSLGHPAGCSGLEAAHQSCPVSRPR